ncbi:MAG: nucleotidyltransferase domain-containing protein [Candidatus Lokiarchaeota archaeon]|nr:nucleotidyltransferase domain-containing protein [Candidatus Lokiarchaeota archaeon]
MKDEIKPKINKFLEEIKKTSIFSRIEFIILYGSYLGDYYYDDSDIDICIFIQCKKEELAKIRLDLLKNVEEDFDIQMFQLLPLYVQIEVLKGNILYVRDEDVLYKISYEIIDEYEDFYPFYEDYINK